MVALFPTRAGAGVYYVATTGSDAAPGSAAAPWATLQHALNSVSLAGGHTVWVADGTYSASVGTSRSFAQGVWVRAVNPYRARITSPSNPALDISGARVGFEGFEITGGLAAGSTGLVYCDGATDLTLRNNIIHDSYHNDLIRLLDCTGTRLESNILYNQAADEDHIDINVGSRNTYLEGNIFFNDFAGSGRAIPANLHQYILVKSSGAPAVITGNVYVRRNLFLHYEGTSGMIRCGADGEIYAECENLVVENNLFLYDPSTQPPGGAVEVLGGRNVMVRANTFSGDSVKARFLGFVRAATVDSPPPAEVPAEAVFFYNNIFSKPSGGLASLVDSPTAGVRNSAILSNLYWNNGAAIPSKSGDFFTFSADTAAVNADPLLRAPAGVTLPRWTGSGLAGGHANISAAFGWLVQRYATPSPGSPAIGGADPRFMPLDDILGNLRDQDPDLGALELGAVLGDGGSLDAGPPADSGLPADGGKTQDAGSPWDAGSSGPDGGGTTLDPELDAGVAGCTCSEGGGSDSVLAWAALMFVTYAACRRRRPSPIGATRRPH